MASLFHEAKNGTGYVGVVVESLEFIGTGTDSIYGHGVA